MHITKTSRHAIFYFLIWLFIAEAAFCVIPMVKPHYLVLSGVKYHRVIILKYYKSCCCPHSDSKHQACLTNQEFYTTRNRRGGQKNLCCTLHDVRLSFLTQGRTENLKKMRSYTANVKNYSSSKNNKPRLWKVTTHSERENEIIKVCIRKAEILL